MKYGIALIAFGLTQLCAMELPLPSLLAPSLAVHLGNLQSDVQRLRKRNAATLQRLVACSHIASQNPEFSTLQFYLNESIAHLNCDSYSLTDALSRIMALQSLAATSHFTPKRTHDEPLAPAAANQTNNERPQKKRRSRSRSHTQ